MVQVFLHELTSCGANQWSPNHSILRWIWQRCFQFYEFYPTYVSTKEEVYYITGTTLSSIKPRFLSHALWIYRNLFHSNTLMDAANGYIVFLSVSFYQCLLDDFEGHFLTSQVSELIMLGFGYSSYQALVTSDLIPLRHYFQQNHILSWNVLILNYKNWSE